MNREEELRDRVATLEHQVATLKACPQRRGIRKRSDRVLWGLPLYEIAVGPDPEKGEVRGHARAIIAIGDIATGVFALGGFARGLVAVGGVAVGASCFGGLSIGVLLGVGGLATGLLALGGVAVGAIAVGGVAFGYYACGGVALGKYVVSGIQQNPEAIQFFSQWIPGKDQLLQRRGG
ncbi:MAG: hypothetical protein ACYC0X_00075 [Pirellulaceae bacterium]